jgi:transposase InsO family protein
VTEQRYKAVLAVIGDGRTVSEVARDWGISRRTMHRWLARYETDGLEGLNNRSHRPAHCPHQTSPAVEAMALEMRRAHSYWGARRIAFELARKQVEPSPSESAVYRCLVRSAVIDPDSRRRRREEWKRWERATPMELWQLDVVHGFALADGSTAKALTGIDDHSRFCVSAQLMLREPTQAVCDGFSSALRENGVPAQVLTDNGKVLTGRFAQPPVEVLFDRICRENGVDHILTQPGLRTTIRQDRGGDRTSRVGI